MYTHPIWSMGRIRVCQESGKLPRGSDLPTIWQAWYQLICPSRLKGCLLFLCNNTTGFLYIFLWQRLLPVQGFTHPCKISGFRFASPANLICACWDPEKWLCPVLWRARRERVSPSNHLQNIVVVIYQTTVCSEGVHSSRSPTVSKIVSGSMIQFSREGHKSLWYKYT